MGCWEHRYLGWDRFPESLSELEIDQFFTLRGSETAVAATRRGSLNRLGVALQIGFLKMTGRPLNSVQIVPVSVFDHLGRQLDCPPPRIASIRTLYRRRRTLFEHQSAALEVMGFATLPDHAERGLVAYLRREAIDIFDAYELAQRARSWLFEHKYVLPHERRIRQLVTAARWHREQLLIRTIRRELDEGTREPWVERLVEPVGSTGVARLDWLRQGPSSKSGKDLEEQLAKVAFLKELGAEQLVLSQVALRVIEHHARPMMVRKPAALRRLKEPRRTLQIACFLRVQLLRWTDTSLNLVDHKIADLWRAARQRAQDAEAQQLRRYRRLVLDLQDLAADEALSAAEIREQLRLFVAKFTPEKAPNRTAATRRELARQTEVLGHVLNAARMMALEIPVDHPLAEALRTVNRLSSASTTELPAGHSQPFGPTWAYLIDQGDRKAALASYRAATVMLIKRALRNGSVSVSHSLSYRAPEDQLISVGLWERDRGRFLRDLNLPASCEKYLSRTDATLIAGLEALAEAVAAGAVTIEGGRLRLPRSRPRDEDSRLEPTRRALLSAMGDVQLPDVLIEIDGLTRFSWILLGRSPRSEKELVILYAALVALGSDLSASDLVRMVPGVGADSVGQMMVRLAADNRLREANDAVLSFMRGHPIAQLWGPGLFASADMMSLDATRYLWSARLDPRRRTFAVGTYTHVLDQWGIIYDQPIVLNKRQAGAAIEGALRQQQSTLARVTVDTHGFTHMAMALAKLVGFDLCPRLAKLGSRKLYLPRGLPVPAVLRPIVAETVSKRTISRGWDGLLRLASSMRGGWCSATYALDRYGSASRGDHIYEAGTALGKLLRTLYLCDYLSNASFRSEILDLLNQGEAVHSLQRAIHHGAIRAKRGRTPEQLTAISGALTLLANVIMTWNTQHMQAIIDNTPTDYPPDLVSRIAPIAHVHINMRGVFTFTLGRHRTSLLTVPPGDRIGTENLEKLTSQ